MKPLPDKQVAVLVLNTGETTATTTLSLEDDVPGQPKGTSYRSVWDKQDVAIVDNRIPLILAVHDSVLMVLSKTEYI